MRSPVGWLVPVALSLAACSSTTAVDGELELTATKTSFSVFDDVAVRIDNHTETTVFLAHCNYRIHLLIERRSGEEWQHHGQVNGAACLGIHDAGEVGIDRGASRTETLRIEEPGEYRLRLYGRLAHQDFGSLDVRSSPFVMHYPPD